MSCINMGEEITMVVTTKEKIMEKTYQKLQDEYGMFILTPETFISEREIFIKSDMDHLSERIAKIEKDLGL